MDLTDHYGLLRLTEDDLSANSFKFSDADRVLIDRILYLGAEGHHHTGGAASDNAPTLAPVLTLSTSGGTIPASRRVYYKYTYIDGDGIETTESPVVYVDTPTAVSAPGAPTLVNATTGGTLNPGGYYYIISAYTDFNDLETTADNAAYIAVPYTTSTNKITVTLPTLPGGADGYNIYRKAPGNVGYRYLASTTSSSYLDDGSDTPNYNRPPATSNTTVAENSIEVSLPGATPALPEIGWSWRIYRTYLTDDFTNSLLATVTDPTVTYTDIGASTSTGEPPPVGAAVGTPPKILLTDAAEVQGVLPVANIEDFTTEVEDVIVDLVPDMFVDSSTIDFRRGDSATPTALITADVKPIVLTTRAVSSYTPILTDAGYVIEMNVASANNFTVPPNSSVAYAVGTVMEVFQYGAGQTTIVAGGGVTLRSAGAKLKLTQRYSSAALRKIATDEWAVVGDLTV